MKLLSTSLFLVGVQCTLPQIFQYRVDNPDPLSIWALGCLNQTDWVEQIIRAYELDEWAPIIADTMEQFDEMASQFCSDDQLKPHLLNVEGNTLMRIRPMGSEYVAAFTCFYTDLGNACGGPETIYDIVHMDHSLLEYFLDFVYNFGGGHEWLWKLSRRQQILMELYGPEPEEDKKALH
ncbi:unnamed protein product, partial [Mesorhabditis spiculigera]